MPSVITLTDFPSAEINDVVEMSLRNDFYFSCIWSFLKRSYPPIQLARLRRMGYSQGRIEKEFVKRDKSKDFGWVCNKLMIKDKLVGFTIWDYPKKGTKCMLEFVFVEPKYRGNGFGNLLISHFKIQASLFKKTVCKIQVSQFDEKLQKFYLDWGWEHGEPESPIDPVYIEMYCVLPPIENAIKEKERLILNKDLEGVFGKMLL
jgi:GNAT superfamily N-acetyltransferase